MVYVQQTVRNQRKENKRKKRRIFSIFFSALLLIFLMSTVFVSRLDRFLIKDIKINGVVYTDEKNLKEKINPIISGYYLFFIPKNSFFIYPKGNILRILKNSYPSTKNIGIDIEGNNLVISFDEKRPEALWCKDDSCFYVDSFGVLFTESPKIEGSTYIVFRGGLAEGDLIGKRLFDEGVFVKVFDFTRKLKILNINPNSISIENYTKTVINYGQSNSSIVINPNDDLGEVYSNFLILINSDNFKKEVSDINSIDYLDLRYGKKAFFKTK